jgi:raffinose/stachyose/melibiose transport system substrate-binding protein
MADDYMAAHPNVKVEITVLENEAFKTKLTTVMQSGDPPDIFQSWGGGTFDSQVKAGLLKDITSDLAADSAWKDSFAPGALGVSAPTARTTACHGTWAWSAGGITKTSSRKLGSPIHPPPGLNS